MWEKPRNHLHVARNDQEEACQCIMRNKTSIQNVEWIVWKKPFHDKTNKMNCAASADSGQPGQSLYCPHDDT